MEIGTSIAGEGCARFMDSSISNDIGRYRTITRRDRTIRARKRTISARKRPKAKRFLTIACSVLLPLNFRQLLPKSFSFGGKSCVFGLKSCVIGCKSADFGALSCGFGLNRPISSHARLKDGGTSIRPCRHQTSCAGVSTCALSSASMAASLVDPSSRRTNCHTLRSRFTSDVPLNLSVHVRCAWKVAAGNIRP